MKYNQFVEQAMHPMQPYHDLMEEILTMGVLQPNRTGISAYTIPGAMLKFDLQEGFPLVTTKKMYVKQTIGELIAFARGYTNAADFRKVGCTFWDANANKDGKDMQGNLVPNKWLSNPHRKGEDDLGRIYGAQWRDWRGASGSIDQVQNVVNKLLTDPTDRRMIISAWRPDEISQMALPPCHVMHQFIADTQNKVLHLTMNMRSADLFLGVPHNIASYAMWLHVIATITGFTPGTLTMFMADVHIYENHVDQANLQLTRHHFNQPTLLYRGPGSDSWDHLNGGREWFVHEGTPVVDMTWCLNNLLPEHFVFEGYECHPPIAAEMAV